MGAAAKLLDSSMKNTHETKERWRPGYGVNHTHGERIGGIQEMEQVVKAQDSRQGGSGIVIPLRP